MMSMTRSSSYKAINLIKKTDKKIKIIVGGIHPTIMYNQLLKNFPIDCIIVGEGELTIKELIPALLKNKKLDKIKGLAFKTRGRILRTENRELIQNLNTLPFPSHDIFMNPKRIRICLLSSRGCPNQCSFCCLHALSKRRYRERSYLNVVEEIEQTISKFPQIKEVEFSDDTFTLNEKKVIDFCKEIVKRKIKLSFVCSARIKPASEKLFFWMGKAGFREVRFGVESGSRKILKSIHKNITPEEIIETFKIASKFPKVKFVKFLMVGFPGENEETIRETIKLTKKLNTIIPMDFFYATPLWVYPGTEVYEIMKSSGKINDDFWLTDEPCPHYTVKYSRRELYDLANRIGFETCLARGYLYFVIFLIKKAIKNPGYEFKRFVRGRFLMPVLRRKFLK